MRAAIILGGGRSTRMGRDKAALLLGGRSLLARAVDACLGCDPIVVVTPGLPPDVDPNRVTRTLEQPPFGGPAAGISAGLRALPAAVDEVVLLACDLANVAGAMSLLEQIPLDQPGTDGVCLVDDQEPQYLAGRYRRSALAARAASAPSAGRSVRHLMAGLRLQLLAAEGLAADLDSPGDVSAHRLPPDSAGRSGRVASNRPDQPGIGD